MGSVEKRWSSQSRKNLRIIPKKIHMITGNLVRNILKMESIGFAKKNEDCCEGNRNKDSIMFFSLSIKQKALLSTDKHVERKMGESRCLVTLSR